MPRSSGRREGGCSSCPSSCPTSTTARTSTTTWPRSGSGRRVLDHGAARAPTSSPATSSRSTAETGRPASPARLRDPEGLGDHASPRALHGQPARRRTPPGWRGRASSPHGWRPVVTDGAVTDVRARPARPRAPPFPEPPRDDAIFCAGLVPATTRSAHQMSSSHASAVDLRRWAALALPRLAGATGGGDHGRRSPARSTHVLRKVLPQEPTRVQLAGERWHLVALETDRLPVVRGKPRGARIIGYALP